LLVGLARQRPSGRIVERQELVQPLLDLRKGGRAERLELRSLEQRGKLAELLGNVDRQDWRDEVPSPGLFRGFSTLLLDPFPVQPRHLFSFTELLEPLLEL